MKTKFLELTFATHRSGAKNDKKFFLNPKYIIRMTPYHNEDGEFVETKLTIVNERNDIHVNETPEEILYRIRFIENGNENYSYWIDDILGDK